MPVKREEIEAPYFLGVGQNLLNQPPYDTRIRIISDTSGCAVGAIRRGLIYISQSTELPRLPQLPVFDTSSSGSTEFYLQIRGALDRKFPSDWGLLEGIIDLASGLRLYPNSLAYIRENYEKPYAEEVPVA